jgi:Phage ABA sandwich domain
MNKIDSIARRILGWKLNRWDRWYDHEKGIFIQDSEFQPEQNLGHAMLVAERLEKFGYKLITNGVSEARFNNVFATGDTLAQAITNAAYSIIENNSTVDRRVLWNKLC